MRQAQALSGIVIGGAVALLATQPSLAVTTQVTAVRLENSGGELQLTLETKAGAQRPQVFTVSRGNDLVADLVNTQLSLNKGDSFSQADPMPGISSVVVSQPDANSVRVTVSGTSNPPTSQVLQSNQDLITLGISTQATPQAEDSNPVTSSPNDNDPVLPGTLDLPSLQAAKAEASPATIPTPVSQTPISQPLEEAPNQAAPTSVAQKSIARPVEQAPTPATPTSIAQTTVPQPVVPVQAPVAPAPAPQAPVQAPAPDVLVPNPQITIDGFPVQPAGPAGTVQPVAPAPPLLPRAIAPPVGDIAISNISAAASVIDLGTGVRVPRLVLREAPVREVLALLARSAGLNLAFTDGGGTPQSGAPGGAAGGAQQTISLDLENEPVQDVFNYVLQLSGLQANRVGRTIFVGSRLPDTARNLVARTLRLNQVPVGQAVGFLISQGAEQQQITTQTTLTVVGEGAAAQRIQNTQTQVSKITPQETAAAGGPGGAGGAGLTGPLVLRGLAVSPDERLGAITLIGEPRKVEIATALLTQLDLRRRQVAVNVKIVDVNLSGTDVFNASFSFGIGDSFFVNDGGAASFNYGGIRPPTQGQLSGSITTPPVINNPFAGSSVFLDPNSTVTLPNASRTVILNQPGQNPVQIVQQDATVIGGVGSVTLTDPLRPGITGITLPTDTIITFNADGTSTATAGQTGSITTALPSLFQFPKRLLSALQAQVTSGNAKILTDPTLVVQEGQTATVNLTQEVFGGFRLQTQTDPTTNLTTQVQEPIIKRAGLILPINVQKIDDNGFITLTVNPVVSAIGGSQSTPQGQITLVQERQLQSGQIRLRDGQTLILSGIIQESDRTEVRKVPILGDIPILGALFRSTSRVNQRQEVIVLLTPQIIDDAQGSSFGYSYTPGRETRQLLQRQGVSP
ncbi:AMIN domain-containing protein [Allocoleopsis franciscana]|uniref:Type II secretory pathway, component HofQ n=1 Tax=Allocoleopsis franciscana PCC 7113 TaxID=1173027 RepID=K9WKN1_9CYAN|nr:AMIN domain-containing protein [Allocoleopsis franciscana]AFZ20339.1 type II secretory pathway, component HofQ [Allocoleopsis franciscana PCC 7113]